MMIRILPINLKAVAIPSGFTPAIGELVISDETYTSITRASSPSFINITTGLPVNYQRPRCVAALIQKDPAALLEPEVEYSNAGVTEKMTSSEPSSDLAAFFHTVPSDFLAVTDMILRINSGVPSVINLAFGYAYEFPCIENASLAPAEFNPAVTYNNNLSQKGAFIGRTVVRKSSSLDIRPLSFVADATRRDEVLQMLAEIETRAFYVHYKVNNVDYVNYGWLDEPPTVEYVGDEEYMKISIRMRCPA